MNQRRKRLTERVVSGNNEEVDLLVDTTDGKAGRSKLLSTLGINIHENDRSSVIS